jgi:hypothetical protein
MIRGVNEVDTEINRPMKDPYIATFVGVAQFALKSRAAVSDGRNFQPFFAKKAKVHDVVPPRQL